MEISMSREVRRVPANWQHPTDGFYASGEVRHTALFDGADFDSAAKSWDEESAKWERGEFPDYASAESRAMSYVEWNGNRPDPADYMPNWSAAERTHLMMYETTSEGTPISPAFATAEELARWLTNNQASAFGSCKASYEAWLRVAQGGFAPGAVFTPERGLISGVEAMGSPS
jgi:hypothetical protein